MSSISINHITTVEWLPLADNTFELMGEIDIVRIKTDTASGFFSEMLLPHEIQKMNRYRNQQSRNQFMAGRGGVRYLSAKYTGRLPQDLTWNEGLNKKPRWQFPDDGLCFNIAHSGAYILLCFGHSEMGIDIERIQNEFAYDEMLNRCFDAGTIRAIQNARDPRAVFYLFWTRKEALLKAGGAGIHDNLAIVPCMDGVHVTDTANDWRVNSFRMEENYMVSLACYPQVTSMRFWDFG